MAQNSMYNGKFGGGGCLCNTIKLLLLIEIIFVDFVRSKKNTTNPFTKILTT
jgi:hypothetical protein